MILSTASRAERRDAKVAARAEAVIPRVWDWCPYCSFASMVYGNPGSPGRCHGRERERVYEPMTEVIRFRGVWQPMLEQHFMAGLVAAPAEMAVA